MNNRLIGMIIGTTVAIIVIALCLAPIVSDAEKNVGAYTTVDNSHTSVYTLDKCPTNTVIEIGAVDGDLMMTVNGNAVDITSSANVPIIVSDAVSGNPNSNGTLVSLAFIDGQTMSATTAKPATLEFADGTLTATFNGAVVFTGEYSWIYALSNDGPYWPTSASSIYVKSINDVIFAGSTSSIWWSFHNNEFVGTAGYTFKASYDIELVEGTTDIYEVKSFSAIASKDGTDTTLTPSRIIAPAEISGHEESAQGQLISILPLFAIVAVLGGIVAVVARKP